MLGQKGKISTSKNDNTTRGNKPEITGERKKIKKILRQSDIIQTKQDIQSNEKKFYQQVGGDGTKTYQQRDAKEANQFGAKYGNHKNIKKVNR